MAHIVGDEVERQPAKAYIDIIRAASALGYDVVQIGGTQVTLETRDQRHILVTLNSLFLTGDALRELLVPQPPAVPHG